MFCICLVLTSSGSKAWQCRKRPLCVPAEPAECELPPLFTQARQSKPAKSVQISVTITPMAFAALVTCSIASSLASLVPHSRRFHLTLDLRPCFPLPFLAGAIWEILKDHPDEIHFLNTIFNFLQRRTPCFSGPDASTNYRIVSLAPPPSILVILALGRDPHEDITVRWSRPIRSNQCAYSVRSSSIR
jgi:hypothetical protein